MSCSRATEAQEPAVEVRLVEIRGIYSRKDHGVKLKTLSQQYMEDPEFRHALETTRSEAAALARSELEGLMLKSVIVLAEALEDPASAVRLRAASAALALGLKSGDVKELHRRLDHLDSAFALYRSKGPPYPFVNQRGSY